MKKAKYSGGDWNMDTGDDGAVVYNQDGTIATIPMELKAYKDNAKLIQAAPRLVETLQKILDRLETNPMQDDELAKICRREIKAAI